MLTPGMTGRPATELNSVPFRRENKMKKQVIKKISALTLTMAMILTGCGSSESSYEAYELGGSNDYGNTGKVNTGGAS